MWEIVFFAMDLFFEIRWEIRPFYDLTISDFIRLKKNKERSETISRSWKEEFILLSKRPILDSLKFSRRLKKFFALVKRTVWLTEI